MNRKTDKRSSSSPGKTGMSPVHPDAAGIDVGATHHVVAVREDRSGTPIRTFGCATPQLEAMAAWLGSCGVTTVAMESTGVYWIPVAEVLDRAGMEVFVVDARLVGHVPGRKTDVQDCQWIRQLHEYGLLRGALRLPRSVEVLRNLWRHRKTLVESCATRIQRMHKALEQMNIQLHKAISDVTGVTGQAIIRAILRGERDPRTLAGLRHPSVRAGEDEIIAALTGTWRDDHLFALSQAVNAYDFFQAQIAETDREVERHLRDLEGADAAVDVGDPPSRRKNQPHFDLRGHLIRVTGADLTKIPGIDAGTAFTVVTEIGTDMSKFPTEKHFCSYLGLCPSHRITGGKVQSRRSRPVPSRAAHALRVAAQSLHHSKSAIGGFLRRMKSRKGPAHATTATAHKLARLVYRALRYGDDYVEEGQLQYETRFRERQISALKKRAKELGLEIRGEHTMTTAVS